MYPSRAFHAYLHPRLFEKSMSARRDELVSYGCLVHFYFYSPWGNRDTQAGLVCSPSVCMQCHTFPPPPRLKSTRALHLNPSCPKGTKRSPKNSVRGIKVAVLLRTAGIQRGILQFLSLFSSHLVALQWKHCAGRRTDTRSHLAVTDMEKKRPCLRQMTGSEACN